ncbi:hypothetical protein [Pseudomonas sp. LF242]
MADSYGLMFKGSVDNRVIIDSERTRLSVICKGRYNNNSGLFAITSFPFTITSILPPFVFIRPDPVSGQIGMSRAEVLGSAGAWTGFQIRAYDNSSVRPNGQYFAAGFGAEILSDYGVRLRDGSRKIIFDTGTPTALFSNSNSTWTFTGSGSTAQGQSINFFSSPFVLSDNEYVLINTMSMPVTRSLQQQSDLQFIWDYPNKRMIAGVIYIPGYNTTSLGISTMTAKMVV